jgi:hypothetical protein
MKKAYLSYMKMMNSLDLVIVTFLLASSVSIAGADYYFWNSDTMAVPGGGTTDVSVAATSFGDKLYLFAKGIEDKRIYFTALDAAGTWSGSWTEVPGDGTTDVALAATIFPSPATGSAYQLYLFAKGIDDKRIYFTTMDAAGTWSGSWTEVPGDGTTDVALAATSGHFAPIFKHSDIYLFGKGIDDNRIYVTRYTEGTNNVSDGWPTGWYGQWIEVSGGGTTDAAPAVVSAAGVLVLFGKGIDDDKIYSHSLNFWGASGPDAVAYAWIEVPNVGTTDAAPAVAVYNTKIYLFTKGIDDKQIYVTTADIVKLG